MRFVAYREELFGSLCSLNLFVLILSEKKKKLLKNYFDTVNEADSQDFRVKSSSRFIPLQFLYSADYVLRTLLYLIVCWHNLFFLVFQCVMGNSQAFLHGN